MDMSIKWLIHQIIKKGTNFQQCSMRKVDKDQVKEAHQRATNTILFANQSSDTIKFIILLSVCFCDL